MGFAAIEKQEWNNRSRPRDGFTAKSDPRPTYRSRRQAASTETARWEFPAKTHPNHGRTPLTDHQKSLAARFLPLARSIARQHRHKGSVEHEEIESVAFLGLVEAARSYDPDRETSFPTYARFHIVGAVMDFFNNLHARRKDRLFSTIAKTGREEVDSYGKPVGITPDGPIGSEIDAVEEVESHLRPMSTLQAWICRQIYLEGKSPEEVAQIMDCTRSYVSRLHREAIEFLSERFRNRGEIGARLERPLDDVDEDGQDTWCQAQPLRPRVRMPRSRRLAAAS